MPSVPTGSYPCKCSRTRHQPRLVVLTGGPGGGKTAILEMARRYFCRHVVILPEAASIVFAGGFPRIPTAAAMRAAQRAIFAVQRELERIAVEAKPAVVLCDRGSLDGIAYWPGSARNFCEQFGTSVAHELARYSAVVHVEVPASAMYERSRIRRESAAQAKTIDRHIARVWKPHPRQMAISAEAGFLDKLAYAIDLLGSELPDCCRKHLHGLGGGVQNTAKLRR
jgi:predicted ATPase